MAVSDAGQCLFVFDFDHSLIDDNTDTWIMGVRPELRLRERLGALRRQFTCWTDLMDHMLTDLRYTVYPPTFVSCRLSGKTYDRSKITINSPCTRTDNNTGLERVSSRLYLYTQACVSP